MRVRLSSDRADQGKAHTRLLRAVGPCDALPPVGSTGTAHGAPHHTCPLACAECAAAASLSTVRCVQRPNISTDAWR